MTFKKLPLLFFLFFNSTFFYAQDFGCFDIRKNENLISGNVINSIYDFDVFQIQWSSFKLNTNVKDGSYSFYKKEKAICDSSLIFDGSVLDGQLNGTWKYYVYDFAFFKGRIVDNMKVGEWNLYFLNSKSKDTIVVKKVYFENDKIIRILEFDNSKHRIKKSTEYKDNLKHGKEILYSLNEDPIESIKGFNNYEDGILHGEFLQLDYNKLSDTITHGYYYNGIKNGEYVFRDKLGNKHVLYYNRGIIQDKYIKFYKNGTKAWEATMKNNLFYDIHEMYDSTANPLDFGTFKNGNGTLKFYFPNGELMSSQEMKNQCISGEITHYTAIGNIGRVGILMTKPASLTQDWFIENCDDPNMLLISSYNFLEGTDFSHFIDGNYCRRFKSVTDEFSFTDKNVIQVLLTMDDVCLSEHFELNGLLIGLRSVYQRNGKNKFFETYAIIDSLGQEKSVLEGRIYDFNENGQLIANLNFHNDKYYAKSYFFDDFGFMGRIYVVEPNGCNYSVYFGDTVNRIDKQGKKQGKWLENKTFFSNECINGFSKIKFYKNDLPDGTWSEYLFFSRKLNSTYEWLNDSTAFVKKYNYKGMCIAEGTEINGKKEGKWYFYKKGRKLFSKVKYYQCGKEL